MSDSYTSYARWCQMNHAEILLGVRHLTRLACLAHVTQDMSDVLQHVIVMRGRFAAWEFPALDLDIMVKVGCQHKRVSQAFWDVVHHARQFYLKVHRTSERSVLCWTVLLVFWHMLSQSWPNQRHRNCWNKRITANSASTWREVSRQEQQERMHATERQWWRLD